MDFGIPLTLIGEAVYARCLSALKSERLVAAKELSGTEGIFNGDREAFLADIEQALYAAKTKGRDRVIFLDDVRSRQNEDTRSNA